VIVELFANPLADLARNLACVDGGVQTPVEREHDLELAQVGLHGGLHVRVLELAGERPSIRRRGAVNLPSDAAAAGWRSKEPKRVCQPGPSSACMRRRTKAAPMGGASLWSFCSSAAYSGGTTSGMVARSCATFMMGPLRPPSACARAAALPAELPSPPNSRFPAMRAATPPMLAPTRA
jgi:hypothetical protein